MFDDIGQVILALGIVVIQCRQQFAEPVAANQQQRRITLADRRLFGVAVALFDDRDDAAVRVAQDTPVAERILGFETQHADRGFAVDGQTREGLGAYQRYVAGQHQHVVARVYRVETLLQRMAGAKLLALLDE